MDRSPTPEVLIVDDDRRLARLLARQLDNSGYATRCVHDGATAVALVRREPPQLILLDLLLPGRDGFAVLRQLREMPTARSLPVIVMSGVYPSASHSQALEEAGACAFLDKPFRGQDLLAHARREIGPGDRRRGRGGATIDLSSCPVADVLWEAVEAEFSGVLHFRRGEIHKMLLLEGGDVRAVRSNLESELLGSRLLASGRITSSQLAEAAQRACDGVERLGEALVELGFVSDEGLKSDLATQAHDKLMELFTWTEGEAWRQRGLHELPVASPLHHWDADDAIFEGARRMPLGLVEQRLAPHRDDEVLVDAGTFDVSTQGRSTIQLFAMLAPGVRVGQVDRGHLPALYAAWRTGRLRFGGVPRSQTTGDLELELHARLERLARANRFEVLGLTPAAGREEIDSAYQQLQAEYGPERFVEQPRRVRELASSVYAAIRGAWDVLGDDLTRQTYVAKLRSGEADDGEVTLTRVACAEADFQRAEMHAARREYDLALEALGRVLEREPDVAEYLALHAWCVFVTRPDDPAAAREAVESLKGAMQSDPNCSAGPYYLGLVYKGFGKLEPARSLMKRTLVLDADHAGARRELRLINSRLGRAG